MNKGDLVKCIDNFGCNTLYMGGYYEVLDVRCNAWVKHINIQVKGYPPNWYRADRFKFIKHLDKKEVTETMALIVKHGYMVKCNYVHSGQGVVTEISADGKLARIVGLGYSSTFHDVSDIIRLKVHHLVENSEILSDLEVFNALVAKEDIEVFNTDHWHKVANHEVYSISKIQTHHFRRKPKELDYYTETIPAPIKDYPSLGVVYGISFSKQRVYKCNVNQRCGNVHWATGEDAQRALEAIFKPFGKVIAPLDERLTKDYQ